MKAERAATHSRGDAGQHHDQPAEDRADRRDEGEQSCLDAQDERALDADDRKPDPGHQKHRDHGNDLRDQPALQRLPDPVDDRGRPRAVSGRRHEQQSVAVDAGLGRKGDP
jgi:hypothetical protein